MLCTYAMVLVPCVCFYVFILPGSDIIMWVAGSIVPVGITLSMLGATATDPGVLEVRHCTHVILLTSQNTCIK